MMAGGCSGGSPESMLAVVHAPCRALAAPRTVEPSALRRLAGATCVVHDSQVALNAVVASPAHSGAGMLLRRTAHGLVTVTSSNDATAWRTPTAIAPSVSSVSVAVKCWTPST